jgi:hypothetical protein
MKKEEVASKSTDQPIGDEKQNDAKQKDGKQETTKTEQEELEATIITSPKPKGKFVHRYVYRNRVTGK